MMFPVNWMQMNWPSPYVVNEHVCINNIASTSWIIWFDRLLNCENRCSDTDFSGHRKEAWHTCRCANDVDVRLETSHTFIMHSKQVKSEKPLRKWFAWFSNIYIPYTEHIHKYPRTTRTCQMLIQALLNFTQFIVNGKKNVFPMLKLI